MSPRVVNVVQGILGRKSLKKGVTMSAVRPKARFLVETFPKFTVVSIRDYKVFKKVTWVSECERWFTVSGEGFWSLQDVANSL